MRSTRCVITSQGKQLGIGVCYMAGVPHIYRILHELSTIHKHRCEDALSLRRPKVSKLPGKAEATCLQEAVSWEGNSEK